MYTSEFIRITSPSKKYLSEDILEKYKWSLFGVAMLPLILVSTKFSDNGVPLDLCSSLNLKVLSFAIDNAVFSIITSGVLRLSDSVGVGGCENGVLYRNLQDSVTKIVHSNNIVVLRISKD